MAQATLAALLRRAARAHGDAPALAFPGGTLSYAELQERSNRMANALAGAGVGPGDRVALLARNGPAFFELVFGAAQLNAVPTTLNWRLAPPELRQVLDDAEPTVLIVEDAFLELLDAAEAQGGSRPGPAPARVLLGPAGRGGPAYEDWLAAAPVTERAQDAGGDDVALLVYTSGTTGRPRGVEATNAALSFLFARNADAFGFGRGSVTLAAMPLFHVSGSGWSFVALHEGGRVVIVPEVDPGAMLNLIEAERVTHLSLVTTVVEFLLAHPKVGSADLSSLQLLAYGGSPASPEMIRRAAGRFDCDLVQLYGLSEALGPVTELPAADHDPARLRPERLGSCGVPYDWVELRITDLATGRPAPPGVTGEICLRTPHVMRGYRGRPDETAEVLSPDGWLRTGDAGYRDADGYLHLQDRVKDMIISGGENVYPVEVEQVIADHPAVAGVAVVGVPDDRWGEVPRAVVIPAEESRCRADLAAELVAWCRERLAHYKCPAAVDFVDDFPRTGSGKVLKRQLRAPYWAGRPRAI